jgi:hypothetical protein
MRVQVVPVGAQKIDLGSTEWSQVAHMTLVSPEDTFVGSFRIGAGGERTFSLLVPARSPEQQARTAERPAAYLQIGRRRIDFRPVDAPVTLTEPLTGLTYTEIARTQHTATRAQRGTVHVVRGSRPTRAALRTAVDAPFELEPRSQSSTTMARLRQWHEVAADGSASAADAQPGGRNGSATPWRRRALIPLGFAAVMLLVATWWMRSGRRTSRERSRMNENNSEM